MRKLSIGIAFIVSFIFIQNINAEETIRITNGEWLPYHSEKLPHYGAGSRIVTEAFEGEGLEVKWGFFPWKRAYINVVNGSWNASIGWIKTPKREKEVLFSEPIYGGKWVFFHLKSALFEWKTIEDLKGLNIGAIHGYSYGTIFDNAEKNGIFKVERVTKEEQNFKKLLLGRIHVFAHAIDGGYASLRMKLKPEEVQQITHFPKPIQVVNYHLVFTKTKKNKRMLKLFNKGLRQLRESGKIDQYIKNAWIQKKSE
ncbi:MAG: amino acid ABC transporter substrate-binding protein [Bacteroidetes bacterium]|nr:amino acid ABC transporter substrate-binding protein [Bacteroidota bacterium]